MSQAEKRRDPNRCDKCGGLMYYVSGKLGQARLHTATGKSGCEKKHAEITADKADAPSVAPPAPKKVQCEKCHTLYVPGERHACYAPEPSDRDRDMPEQAWDRAVEACSAQIGAIVHGLECCDSHQEYQEAQVIKPLGDKLVAALRGHYSPPQGAAKDEEKR